jgi:hypothetical protein
MRGRTNARQVQRMANAMTDKTTEFEQQPKHFAYEASDEALESAAMVNGAIKNYTLTFCSTPWTCPMSSRVQMMKPIGKPIPLKSRKTA